MIRPLLARRDLAELRAALTGFTVDGVDQLLGPTGRAALDRGDLAGAERELRGRDDALSTLTRLFTLGSQQSTTRVGQVLGAAFEPCVAAGLLDRDGDEVRAALDVRPYTEADTDEAWWVVSDFAIEARRTPLSGDHVLGIGRAATSLAQATPRGPVAAALDIGTGCGVQALHLGRHAAAVTATDISSRALRMAATTAALSGQSWDLRRGSFCEPVADRRYDLVVTNPPFVVSPGVAEYDYRDGGLAGDTVSELLVRGIPGLLNDNGTGQLLANWAIPADGTWDERLAGWLAGSGCDAWVWQRELVGPGEYVALWLGDAGLKPGTPEWALRYDAWLDWFTHSGVVAVGMGLVTMRRCGRDQPVVVIEDVRQPVQQPAGAYIDAWFTRGRRLAGLTDEQLLHTTLRTDEDLVLTRQDLLGEGGWAPARRSLRQSHGPRWELEVDDEIARVVAACAAGAPPALALSVLAATTDVDVELLQSAAAPVLRDLVGRGLLLFADGGEQERVR